MNPIDETDLHAYVDGLLPAERRAEVERHLAAHAEDARRVQAWRAQNAALRAAFNPILTEPLPPQFMPQPASQFKPKAANERYWLQIAAAFVIAIVSGSSGWMLHAPSAPQPHLTLPIRPDGSLALAHQAAIAHVVYSPEVTRPVEIGAEQEDQLVKWLSKRLGSTINPPKLGKLGYELIGGRLLPGQSGPVAQFMYHNAAGERLTVYVSTDQTQNKDTGFRFAQEGPVNVFYWIDGKFGYALSGGMDKGELARIATAVYDQLQKPG
ncbi:MAG TPA: anti-sigma factor [Burkholderiaceae bacterium]